MGVVQFQILQQAIRVPLPRHLQNEPRSIPKNLQLIAWWSSSTLLGERSKWFLALPGNRLPVRSENNSADEPTSANLKNLERETIETDFFFAPTGRRLAGYILRWWLNLFYVVPVLLYNVFSTLVLEECKQNNSSSPVNQVKFICNFCRITITATTRENSCYISCHTSLFITCK